MVPVVGVFLAITCTPSALQGCDVNVLNMASTIINKRPVEADALDSASPISDQIVVHNPKKSVELRPL